MKKNFTFLCLFLAILSVSAQNFVPVANKYYNLVVSNTDHLVVGADGTKGVLTILQHLPSQAFRFVPVDGSPDTYYIQNANDLYLNQDSGTTFLSKFEAAINNIDGTYSQWVIEGADGTGVGIRLKNVHQVSINSSYSYYGSDGTNPFDNIYMDKPVDNLHNLYKFEEAHIGSFTLYSENFESDFTPNTGDKTFAPSTKNGTWSGGINLTTVGDADINLRQGWETDTPIYNRFNLKILATGAAVTIPNINVAGYAGLNLSYAFVVENAGPDLIPNIEASVDGGTTWTTLPTVASGGGWNKATKSVALPAGNYNAISLRMNPYTATAYDIMFDNFVITGYAISTTWNGTAWSNGTPSATAEAIIDGTYSTTTNGAFTAKKLTVNSGKSLTINSLTNVTVQNEVINNGSLVVQNNANLIQVNNTTNTGNVTVNRNSNTLLRLDYTIWSSPVFGAQTLAQFSPSTSQSPNRFYTYNTATSQYDNTNTPTTATFGQAAGYLIRMPNDASAVTPTAYAGVFTGVLNNGTIPKSISDSGSGYNMVGNPYSSTISADAFMTANTASIESALYFWRKTNAAVVGSAYATYTPLGGAGTTPSTGVILTPNGTIQVGQGFFVKAKAGATAVSFTNAMRQSAPTSTQFFKIKQVKQVNQVDRVWLNLTNASGAFSQALVGYTANATLGVDRYDGLYFNDSPVALTSNINGEEYTVQGRPTFDATDIVPLNFKTDIAGDYTIAIDHADGVFATGQDVLLVDNTTGTETSLTNSSYTFTAAAGTANSRFTLKYQKTLGTNKSVLSDNNVTVYKNKGTLYVNAGDATIANIKVYDVQGRLLSELKNVKATSATIANLKATNQVLIVKITSQENKVVTKKVVN